MRLFLPLRKAYALLPTTARTPDRQNAGPAHKPFAALFLTRRCARTSFAVLLALALFAFFSLGAPSFRATRETYPPYPIPLGRPPTSDTRPPLYKRYTRFEQLLPQHNEGLPYPEGKHAKFVFFGNHVWSTGWGNAMQEMVLNAHLAYSSRRAFVFDDYTWDISGDYSDYNGKLIPARIPLSAWVAGPLAGYPYSEPTDVPRFISWHHYYHVCKNPVILQPEEIRATLPFNVTALQVLEAWIDKLNSIEDRCVEIRRYGDQLFDFWILGSPRLHDVLPSLFASPVVRDFSWSPLVHHAFQQNQHHFTIQTKRSLFPFLASSSEPALTPTPPRPSTLPVLALHIRRGDFVGHCEHLYKAGSTYTGYNSIPDLPDRFFAEDPNFRESMSDEEIKNGYKEKCFVDIDQVRKRVIQVVREWRQTQLAIEQKRGGRDVEGRVKKKLRKMYIMTNGDREWLKELKKALAEDAERSGSLGAGTDFDYGFAWSWDEISTSRDLELGWEARYVSPAIDMYAGQRAEVFVGNGFSSLTANIVMLRVANGVEPWRTRFW